MHSSNQLNLCNISIFRKNKKKRLSCLTTMRDNKWWKCWCKQSLCWTYFDKTFMTPVLSNRNDLIFSPSVPQKAFTLDWKVSYNLIVYFDSSETCCSSMIRSNKLAVFFCIPKCFLNPFSSIWIGDCQWLFCAVNDFQSQCTIC